MEFAVLEFSALDLNFYENILNIFDTWSLQIQPNKQQLSSAGFYYTGRGDVVQCFSRAIRLRQLKKDDDPIQQHRLTNPVRFFS